MTIISGVLAILGGGAVLSSTARRQDDWVPASTLLDLPEHEPTPVTLTMRRLDGFREVIDRRTIFLVKTGESDVAAFNATCTHLGCLVAWDAEAAGVQVPLSRRRLRPQRRGEGRSSACAACESRHARGRQSRAGAGLMAMGCVKGIACATGWIPERASDPAQASARRAAAERRRLVVRHRQHRDVPADRAAGHRCPARDLLLAFT